MPVKEVSMVPVRFTIPLEQARKVHALVERGDYPADAEVLREAVRLLLDQKNVHIPEEAPKCPATS